jgi:hypothetical protein
MSLEYLHGFRALCFRNDQLNAFRALQRREHSASIVLENKGYNARRREMPFGNVSVYFILIFADDYLFVLHVFTSLC